VNDGRGNRLTRAAARMAARVPFAAGGRAGGRRDAGGHAADWRATMRARLVVCAVLFAAWTVAIEARLVYLQVYAHSALQARADRQQLKTLTLPPRRGEIFDRNGRVLAYSVDADTVAADPTEVKDPEATARAVCGAIQTCTPDLERVMTDRLRRRDRQFANLARWISPPDAARVRALELEGIIMLRETKRYYPKRDLAAHVLGFVGTENSGLSGLESRFDSRIRGQEGRLLVQADARQRAMAVREQLLPTSGDGLELTLDQYLQHIAERELRAAIDATNAAGGTVIVMQPHTGDVLALANWPTYNPNAFTGADAATLRNRAVQEIYEPGSTFKIVTASAALEEGVLGPDDPIDCSPGYITFPGRKPIRDVNRYGILSFTDVIVKSSNVGAIKAGLQLGPERMVRYMMRFGFGQRLAPDFRGESAGIVWSARSLDASALASVSMGYQVSVTPLQMAAAVSAVANGGTLYEPRVVRAFLHEGRREEAAPKPVRQAITPETAATLTMMMEEVVLRGTARSAQIPGFSVAGKTGTAAKLVNGRYSKSDYNASFVGFVPSRRPEFAIVVVIDTPRRGPGTHYYGGVAAAPVFQRVAAASLRHLGVAPNLNAPPPVLVARHAPADDELAPRPAHAPAVLEPVGDLVEPGVMPDLRGLSAREAVRELMRLGLTPRLAGDGSVLDHDPQPGARLAGGETAELTLGRRPPAVRAGGPPR
jgi:cell division protein FtsI (penicillin-binding protein 3)